jgi:hypothetical protein
MGQRLIDKQSKQNVEDLAAAIYHEQQREYHRQLKERNDAADKAEAARKRAEEKGRSRRRMV